MFFLRWLFNQKKQFCPNNVSSSTAGIFRMGEATSIVQFRNSIRIALITNSQELKISLFQTYFGHMVISLIRNLQKP